MANLLDHVRKTAEKHVERNNWREFLLCFTAGRQPQWTTFQQRLPATRGVILDAIERLLAQDRFHLGSGVNRRTGTIEGELDGAYSSLQGWLASVSPLPEQLQLRFKVRFSVAEDGMVTISYAPQLVTGVEEFIEALGGSLRRGGPPQTPGAPRHNLTLAPGEELSGRFSGWL